MHNLFYAAAYKSRPKTIIYREGAEGTSAQASRRRAALHSVRSYSVSFLV
jgi:hypothetical protein